MVQYTEAWFNKEYDFYRINEERLEKIKPLLKDKRVVLIMGTWCEDSQREVPGMMKILNQAGFNTAEMEIIAIDEDKRTKEGLEKAYNLAYVPALNLLRRGKRNKSNCRISYQFIRTRYT